MPAKNGSFSKNEKQFSKIVVLFLFPGIMTPFILMVIFWLSNLLSLHIRINII